MAFSKVGANRALQGYFARRAAEREAELDRAARREEFMMNLLERRKQYLLPELMKRFDSIATMETERRARMDAAQSYGFSKKAAAALEASGQLSFELEKLDEIGIKNVSTTYISSLTSYLEDKVESDDQLAKSISAGLNTDMTSREGMAAGFLKAVNANTMEDFESAAMNLMDYTKKTSPIFVPKFEYQSLKGDEISLADSNSISRQLASSLNTFYEDAFSLTDQGVVFNQNADPSVQELFNRLKRKTAELAESAVSGYSAANALDYVVGKTMGGKGVSAPKVIELVDTGELFEPEFSWANWRERNNITDPPSSSTGPRPTLPIQQDN